MREARADSGTNIKGAGLHDLGIVARAAQTQVRVLHEWPRRNTRVRPAARGRGACATFRALRGPTDEDGRGWEGRAPGGQHPARDTRDILSALVAGPLPARPEGPLWSQDTRSGMLIPQDARHSSTTLLTFLLLARQGDKRHVPLVTAASSQVSLVAASQRRCVQLDPTGALAGRNARKGGEGGAAGQTDRSNLLPRWFSRPLSWHVYSGHSSSARIIAAGMTRSTWGSGIRPASEIRCVRSRSGKVSRHGESLARRVPSFFWNCLGKKA